MNFQDINLNDLYNMNLTSLRNLVNESVSQANQQIKDLESSGYAKISHAYKSLSLKQGRENPSFAFASEDLNKAQLVNKYIATTSFLKLKTASIIGTRQANEEILKESGATQEQINEYFDEVEGKKPSRSNQKETSNKSYTIQQFWNLYSKIKQNDSSLVRSEGSTRVMSLLRQVLEEDGYDEYEKVVERIYTKIANEYEEQMESEYDEEEDLWEDL